MCSGNSVWNAFDYHIHAMDYLAQIANSSNSSSSSSSSSDSLALATTNENSEKRLVWVAAHDFSRCLVFAWHAGRIRKDMHMDTAFSLFRNVHLLTTNGDTNMNCYDHHLDVVIPPEYLLPPPPPKPKKEKLTLSWNFRGFQTPKLIVQATNGVKPFQERRKKIFMAGTLRYHSIRRVLGCKGTYRQDIDKLDIMTTKVDDYLGRLNNSKFCLAPRGIAGWAPRGFDAIAMGCIPIFISDYTIFPFQQQLDYSR